MLLKSRYDEDDGEDMRELGGGGKLAINSTVVVTTNVVSAIGLFFAAAWASRKLGVSLSGSYNWLMYVTSYVTLLSGLGMASIGQREIAKHRNLTNKIVALIVTSQSCVGISLILVVFTIVFSLRGAGLETIVFVIINVGAVFSLWRPFWVLQAHQRMIVPAFAATAIDLLQILAVVTFVRSPQDIYVYAVIGCLSLAAKTTFEWLYLFNVKILRISSISPSFRGWIPLLRASVPVAISRAAITIYYSIDAVLIGIFFGDRETGLYSTAYSLMLAFTVPCLSILFVYDPVIVRARMNGPYAALAASKHFTSILCWIGFPITAGAFIWAPTLYISIYGPDFYDGAIYFRWLTLNIVLIFINVSIANPLIAWGHQKQHMRVTVASAAINVVLNLLLLPHFGIFGAIAATLISEIFVLVAVCRYRKRTELAWFRLGPVCVGPFLAALAIILAASGLRLVGH